MIVYTICRFILNTAECHSLPKSNQNPLILKRNRIALLFVSRTQHPGWNLYVFFSYSHAGGWRVSQHHGNLIKGSLKPLQHLGNMVRGTGALNPSPMMPRGVSRWVFSSGSCNHSCVIRSQFICLAPPTPFSRSPAHFFF